ncbi:MAG: 30S ribosomal protein S1 [candidate division WOR-3 bacterium]
MEDKRNESVEIIINSDLSAEKMKKLYDDSFKSYDLDIFSKKDEDEQSRVVNGRVVRITDKDVIIEVGLKSEGVIPLSDFSEPEKVKVGDIVPVFLEAFENEDGFADISLKKAQFINIWPKINESYEKGTNITGIIKKQVKGGMIVDLMGVEAFLPGSQIDLQPVEDMNSLIGLKTEFRVIKLNYKRRNIVVSRRLILESEKESKKFEFLNNLKVGDVVEGIVKNITDFGAFIEIEKGVDGLLYITDMSWGRLVHPSELLSLNEKVKVVITAINREKGRINLGMKQLTPYPWENIEEKYPVGSRVKGKVVSIEDYGAFVEIEKGVEGLIHISEMSWTQHVKKPQEIMQVGDTVEAIVLSIDKKNERISLGLKQLSDNPYDSISVGQKIKGKITKIQKFGAFVEISPGIEGLLHISNISWDNKVSKIEDLYKVGDEVECVVVNIDNEKQRISLGIKQLQKDPIENYREGDIVKGKISEIKDKSIYVTLDDGVKGLIPQRLIAKQSENLSNEYAKDSEIELKVVDIDVEKRRIIFTDKTE